MVIRGSRDKLRDLSFMHIDDLKQTIQKMITQYFSVIKKYAPSHSLESSIGLDIGASRCKAVEVVRTQKGFKILHWVIEPIEKGDIASCVKRVLEKSGKECKEVYTAVSGQGTLIRFIKMPRMPVAQLKESLRLEADKYFPFPSSDIYMDCQILDDDKVKENKMAVMVAVAKKEIIKERLALVASLGLPGSCVGLNAIALANAVIELKQEGSKDPFLSDKKEAFAVIDIGEVKTTVVIFREYVARFTREISIGGKDLTQKMMGILGSHFEEAERVKCNPGNRGDEVFAACQPVLSSLASEIRLSFDYFSSEDGAKVSKVFLTGQSASLIHIKDFFAKELEIDTEEWKPSRELEFGEHVSAEAFFANINQLSVALGLAVSHDD